MSAETAPAEGAPAAAEVPCFAARDVGGCVEAAIVEYDWPGRSRPGRACLDHALSLAAGYLRIEGEGDRQEITLRPVGGAGRYTGEAPMADLSGPELDRLRALALEALAAVTHEFEPCCDDRPQCDSCGADVPDAFAEWMLASSVCGGRRSHPMHRTPAELEIRAGAQ